MKINARKLGMAGAITACILYALFGIILKLYPGQALKLIGTIHMIPKLDYIRSFISVTPRAITTGLAVHTAIGFILFWMIATIYNLLEKIKAF